MPTPKTGPIDVALSLYSGRCTELVPTDVPEGVSPDNQDVVFLPGSVQSRPCTSRLFNGYFPATATVNYMKSYRQANGNPLNLYLDSSGALRVEDPVGSPGVLTLLASVVAASLANSVTADNKEWMAFHDGTHPTDIPRQYNGTFFDRVSQDAPASAIAAVDSAAAGNISAGVHKVVVMFLTRQGYITAPSPPVSWTAAGARKVTVSTLPIGPSNVIARILAFTGAGGSNYFTILENSTVGTPVAFTLVPNNTDTTADIDFTDNALFNAEAIDIAGNNLFNLVVLAPCLGVESFADRLFWFGEWNNIKTFRNMGFEGGTAAVGGVNPLGWTIDTVGGALVAAPVDFGLAWQITGDGTSNAKGRITQGAYQNYLLNPILEPNTKYKFVCWAEAQVANQAGQLVCDLYSPGGGNVIAQAIINISNIPVTGAFVSVDFNVATPTVIAADTVIRIYATAMANGQKVTVDELMMVFTDQPYNDNQFRVSYASLGGLNSLESLDGITGTLGPESDSSAIRATGKIRDVLYFMTEEKRHYAQDDGVSEPGSWTVRESEDKGGAVSSTCVAKGSDWFAYVTQDDTTLSVVIFGGTSASKISQEIQSDFDGANQEAMSKIWAVNDSGAKRIYIGVPTGANTTPDKILPIDYRELEGATQIADFGAIHIGLTGKMVASDRVRKWTLWNIPANCGAILNRTRNKKAFCIGSGLVAGVGKGNVYSFDSTKLTDDDFGAMVPYYTTYFFVNHDMEEQLPVGTHRKLYDKIALFITGKGKLQVTPLADRLDNPVPFTSRLTGPLLNTIQLKAALKSDIEIPGEVSAERVAFKIGVAPITDNTDPNYTNGTDVQFNLQHMSVRLQAHPVSPQSGRAGS